MKMSFEKKKILISACLMGVQCNYKSQASSAWQGGLDLLIGELQARGWAFFPVCPEQLGGMSTPRVPSELKTGAAKVLNRAGVVVSREGADVTECFIKGAQETLRLAELLGVDAAIMKSRSPSCGLRQIYDGTFSGRLVGGNGVAVELLLQNGIEVVEESEFLKKSGIVFSWQR